MLKLADLATRADFGAGLLHISPSRRLIEGPAGSTSVEPIVMKVFLLLLDAGGNVVTRDELFGHAWGGVFVGDDSLNRAIALVRRIAAETAPEFFEIETIPRTGYRLTGEIVQSLAAPESHPNWLSRRGAIVAGSATALAAGAGTIWWATRSRSNPRFDAIMARGDEAFRNGMALENSTIGTNNSPTMIGLYEEAVRLEPKSAKAWGLLGYFKSAASEDAAGNDPAKLVAEAQAANRRALELNPREPNARVGMYLLQGTMFDWATRDRLLRDILATDPANIPAMFQLMPLLQAAGLTRESWMWNERILRIGPFTRACLVVRALKLWILGRVHEADNVIDRVRALWPDYQFATYARLVIFALTGRPGAARALLDAVHGFGAGGEGWRRALDALEFPSPSRTQAASAACVEVARASPIAANDMVMLLCALGQKDAAFDVTQGFLLWRGKLVSSKLANGREVDDYGRRMTQWLFTPPCAIIRADPRFAQLCEDFGLAPYWRARNVKPDYQFYS